MLKNKFGLLLIVLVLVTAISGCSKEQSADTGLIDQNVTSQAEVNYRTDTVRTGDYIVESKTGASLYYPVIANLSWEHANCRFAEILVSKDDYVEEGDVLIRMVSEESALQLEELTLQLARTQEEYETGKTEHEAAIDKAERATWDLSSYAWQRANLEVQRQQSVYNAYCAEMDYQIETLERQIDELTEELSEDTITAPFNGIVASMTYASEGDKVPENETLITLNSTDKIALAAENPSGAFLYNQPVQVTVGSMSYDGHISAASNVLPLEYQTGYMVVDLDEDVEMDTSGRFGSGISLSGETIVVRDVLLCNKRAFELDGGKYYVQILTADGQIHRRPVLLGSSNNNGNGTDVWVIAGVSEGDTLILRN